MNDTSNPASLDGELAQVHALLAQGRSEAAWRALRESETVPPAGGEAGRRRAAAYAACHDHASAALAYHHSGWIDRDAERSFFEAFRPFLLGTAALARTPHPIPPGSRFNPPFDEREAERFIHALDPEHLSEPQKRLVEIVRREIAAFRADFKPIEEVYHESVQDALDTVTERHRAIGIHALHDQSPELADQTLGDLIAAYVTRRGNAEAAIRESVLQTVEEAAGQAATSRALNFGLVMLGAAGLILLLYWVLS